MHPTLVILVVGLTPALLGPHTPNLQRLAAQGGHAPAANGDAGGHLHRAVDAGHGAAAAAATAASPTAGISAISPRSCCGGSRTSWSAARRSGTPPSGAIPTSPAPRCSGGTTCTPAPTGAPRRGRCIRPTAARSPTTTPFRPSCTTSSTRGSAPFRCSSSGARPPTSHPAPGSRARPLMCARPASRRSRSATCRISTTTCSASTPIRPSRASPRTWKRSTRCAAS